MQIIVCKEWVIATSWWRLHRSHHLHIGDNLLWFIFVIFCYFDLVSQFIFSYQKKVTFSSISWLVCRWQFTIILDYDVNQYGPNRPREPGPLNKIWLRGPVLNADLDHVDLPYNYNFVYRHLCRSQENG